MKGEEAFATGDKPVLAHASASGSGAGASPKDGITPRTDYSFYNGTSHATDEEEERGDGEAWDAWYGADARRSWRGRPEGLVALWIVVALLVALSSSVGVGAPPSPPTPPPFCVIAPARQQRERFSDLTADFPADESYYVSNVLEGEIADPATGARFPAYYNGVYAPFCTVKVIATYTCLADDGECNGSADAAKQLCQTSCSNNADCRNIKASTTHPLYGRLCGLLGGARPLCSDRGLSPAGVRSMRAEYQVNVCMAPPAPPPSPPPPPAPYVGPYYYY